MFFHGWGGNSGSCGSTCTAASNRGYATISMTGIGGRGSNNSWKGFGSNDSGQGDSPGLANGWVGKNSTTDDVLSPYTEPGNQGCEEENDRTCNTNAYKVKCYSDCDKATCDSNDGCFWTTCLDSVQQTLAVLRNFLDNHCVDLDRIYGSGCSNGGMFRFMSCKSSRVCSSLCGLRYPSWPVALRLQSWPCRRFCW